MAISLLDFLHSAPATSREIQQATGLSQPVVSRQLKTLGNRVVRIREGRSVRYHLTKNAFGAGDEIPIFSVDAKGDRDVIAHLRPLAQGDFFIEPLEGMPGILLGESGTGLYDDLPFFLEDLKPSGFLGRQIAGKLSRLSRKLSADPRYWTTEQVGRYLVANSDDLAGNLQLGLQSRFRIQRVPNTLSHNDYPACADAVMRGEIPGSSAGGEQPKFTAYNRESGHVIVKFSPADEGLVAQRWRDILITEYHAATVLRSHNLPAARARLFEKGDRFFLESERFDRSGPFGRRSLISLQAVDAEFTGLGSSWIEVMKALNRFNLVSGENVKTVEKLWAFGRLINNTDMHLGNLSLAVENDLFRLLPVYDMCSMGFAPRAGEAILRDFSISAVEEDIRLSAGEMDVVQDMAFDFWDAVVNDDRLSDDLREHVEQNLDMDSGLSPG